MISILVPVYKTEDYLMQCLCSVAKQTYTDYEIVIINDGSPGDCDSIVQEFRTQYPEIRIKYVIQENAGIAAVRNKGLDLAEGDLLMFLDSDDFIEPDMLDDMYRAINQHQADIVMGGYCRSKTYLNDRKPIEKMQLFEKDKQLELLFRITGDQHTTLVAMWGKLYRKHVFSGIRFPIGRTFEDEAVVHRVLQQSRKLVWCDKEYYHYVNRANGIVSTAELKQLWDRADAMCNRAKDLQREGSIFGRDAAQQYYAQCVDICIDQYTRGKIDSDWHRIKAFLTEFLKNEPIYMSVIPWHQRICVLLLKTKSKHVLKYLAGCRFAPGRKCVIYFRQLMGGLKRAE